LTHNETDFFMQFVSGAN